MSPAPSGFVGRAAELAAAGARVAEVLAGRPAVVWVEGEAGSGKTALVDAIVDGLPPAMRVRRAQADEASPDEPGGLLPALGVRGDDGGPLGSGLDLLASWATAQDEGPLAVVVEDLHWADLDSRTALLTAARRLRADRVLLVVTSRPGVDDGWARVSLDPRRCLRLDVGPLAVDEVRALAAHHGVVLGPRDAARLHTHTSGHALHVRTLLVELGAAGLVGGDGGLPAPRSLSSTTTATVAGLPPDARRLVLALAVLSRPASPADVGRIAEVARPADALDALLRTDLVRRRDDGAGGDLIAFSHPLHRVALYDDLPPSARQALHRAAALVLGAGEGLWHRLAAADAPDAALAEDLVAAAERERARGSRVSAARALVGASRVAPDGGEAHLLDAVRLLVVDGRPGRAAQYRARVEACADGPRRDLVLGLLDTEAGAPGLAADALRRAAGADGPADVVAEARVRLALLLAMGGRGDEAVALAETALALDLAPELERQAWVALGVGELMRAGAVAGLARIAPRVPADADDVVPADTDLLVLRGMLHFFAARYAVAVRDLRAAVGLARRAPGVGASVEQLPRAHQQLAHALFVVGEWQDSEVHARLALALVDEEGLARVRTPLHAVLARLAGCVHGRWDDAEAHLASAAGAGGPGGPEAGLAVGIARAMVADARGDPAGVLAEFPDVVAGRRTVPVSAALGWWPMLVEAAVDTGDVDLAEDLLVRLREAAAARGQDHGAVTVGLEGRIAQARGDVVAALGCYERACRALDENVPLLDRGKLADRYGTLLVAQGRRPAGLRWLREARTVLAAAVPYVARVERHLAEAGAGDGPAPGADLGLTERERAVVSLVRRGMTNREAAAELYVTDKAVEYHLGNVYAKLGIRTRRELRALGTV